MTTYIVGRDPAADIQINNPSVSSRHLSIEQRSDGWSIQDLGSTNGTFIVKGIGKVKVSCECVAQNTPLQLGNFTTTIAELLTLCKSKGRGRAEMKPDKDKVFSRYIRTDDGRFVRKGE